MRSFEAIVAELPIECEPERQVERERWARLGIIWYFGVLGLAFDLITPGATYLFSLGELTGDTWLSLVFNLEAACLASMLVWTVRNPVTVAPLCGVLIGFVGYAYILSGRIGIITVVWHGGFGTFLFGAMLTHAVFMSMQCSIAARVRSTMWDRQDNLESLRCDLPELRRDLWGILKILIQGVLGLAAITGVTMSIVFRSGFEDDGVKVMAVKMASGFFICGLSLYVFVAAPVLSLISDCWTLDQGIVDRTQGGGLLAATEDGDVDPPAEEHSDSAEEHPDGEVNPEDGL